VARSQVTEISDGAARYRTDAGGAPAGPPGGQSFWQVEGTGATQATVTWHVKEGNWAIVLMNASGAPNIRAAVVLGAQTNILLWAGLGLLVLGLILGGAGVAMLVSSRSR
jgi:hypothetical protein